MPNQISRGPNNHALADETSAAAAAIWPQRARNACRIVLHITEMTQEHRTDDRVAPGDPSLCLASARFGCAGRSGTRFWRRWGQIAAAAALVSSASAWLFGPRLIWFGILHFIAVALLLGRPLASLAR